MNREFTVKGIEKLITPEEEAYILSKAYLPEHVISLMSLLSRAEPFLIEDYLVFSKGDWVIFIGYPLDQLWSEERCEKVLEKVMEKFHPESIRFIGPQVPPVLLRHCIERQSDQYYRLDLNQIRIRSSLLRKAEKAQQEISVEISRIFSKEHEGLVNEFLKRESKNISFRVRELYRSMPFYMSHSESAYLINGRDKEGRLSAFFVLESGAKNFTTYLLGVRSKNYYIPYASDLLFLKMIELTRQQQKKEIQLGLGVNKGIRRFKEKWGGVPFLRYEYCEYKKYDRSRFLYLIQSIEGKL